MIRWGLVGCGDVAEKKGGPALRLARGSSLDAVCSRTRTKGEAFAARHGSPAVYTDLAAMLADPDIDAVYVATPTFLHASQALAALAAGKRVLVEKPLARTPAECDALIAAGGTLHVAYYRRFWPKWQAIRDEVGNGRLGDIVSATVNVRTGPAGGWRDDPAQAGRAGNLGDIGCHRLDLLCWLIGPPAAPRLLRADGWPLADFLEIEWEAATGARVGVSLVSKRENDDPVDSFTIVGSEKTLTVDPLDGGSLQMESKNGTREELENFENPAPTHLPLIEALVRCYEGVANPDLPDSASGVLPTRILAC